MKTLKEHNDNFIKYHISDLNISRGNGIACPKCASELYDSSPGEVLCSDPTMYNVECINEECDYHGYRY